MVLVRFVILRAVTLMVLFEIVKLKRSVKLYSPGEVIFGYYKFKVSIIILLSLIFGYISYLKSQLHKEVLKS